MERIEDGGPAPVGAAERPEPAEWPTNPPVATRFRVVTVHTQRGGVHGEITEREDGEWVPHRDYQAALDEVATLRAERDRLLSRVEHWKKLGDSVESERAQQLDSIARLGIPDAEDNGGWPIPGATRDTTYALKWAANELATLRAELEQRPGHTCHASSDTCAGCEFAMERNQRIQRLRDEADALRARLTQLETALGSLVALYGPDTDYHHVIEPHAWAEILALLTPEGT